MAHTGAGKNTPFSCLPVWFFCLLLASASATAYAESTPDTAPDPRWITTSARHGFTVTLYPADGEILLNQYHNWIVQLTHSNGAPTYPARLHFKGSMPEHGHGLPSSPQVSQYLGNGRYRIEGVRFNMAGLWKLSVALQTATINDHAEVEIHILENVSKDTITEVTDTLAAPLTWSTTEKKILATLSLSALGKVPASPSNQAADHPIAVKLGKALFFDPRLSANQKISCATCHQEKLGFTDGRQKSHGLGQTLRNAPTLLGVAFNTWFFWDGRRDSLWAQALVPIEAQEELGGSRIQALRLISEDANYAMQYKAIFGMDLSQRLLRIDASPFGNSAQREAWNQIPNADKKAINVAFSNLGKSLAAFERTLLPKRSRVDDYIDALENNVTPKSAQLSLSAARGLKLFINTKKTGCLNCHNGPRLSNGGFHNIGTGNFDGKHLDFGRTTGLRSVLMDEFNCLGYYSDTERENCNALRFLNKDTHQHLQGAFKVPTLRGLNQTAPYMHDGSLTTPKAVLSHYQSNQRQGPADERIPLALSASESADLLNFLNAL